MPMDTQQKRNAIDAVQLFDLVDEHGKHELARALTVRVVAFGDIVFAEGDVGDSMYLVVAGKARVVGRDVKSGEASLALLGPGEYFGEGALLSDDLRSSTIRASEDLVLLRLDREDFRLAATRCPALREAMLRCLSDRSVLNFLKQFTIMGAVPAHVLRALVTELEEVQVKKGEVVISEGDVDARFFIVRTGILKVMKDDNGEQAVVGNIAEGEYFGELSLMTGAPRAATVVAESDCALYTMTRNSFERVCSASEDFRRQLEKKASFYRTVLSEHPGKERISYEMASAEEAEKASGADTPKPSGWRRLLRKYPFVQQHDETDCSAACLGMITRYYNVPVGVARLRDLSNVDADGATMWSVAQAAETLGFHARGLHLSFDALKSVTLPAIAHWEGYHYIVLYEVNEKHVVAGDPGIELRRLSAEDFKKGWTGRILELIPTAKLGKTERIRTPYKRFWPIIRPHLKLIREILAASLILSLFGLAIPFCTQMIIDRVLVSKSVGLLNMLLVGMLLVACFSSLMTVVRRLLLVHVSTRIDARLVSDFMRHVFSLPMRFFDLRRVGDIVSRVSENEKIRAAMVGTIPGVVLDVVLAGVYITIMAFYSLKMTLIVLAGMPLFVLLILLFTPMIRRNRKEHFSKHAAAWSYLIESITGLGTVKAVSAEHNVRWQMETLFLDSLLVGRKGAHIETVYSAVAGFLQAVSAALFLWYGAHQVMANAMSVGQMLAFIVLAGNVMGPILRLVDAWDDLQDVRNAVERLNDVFDARPEEHDGRVLLSLKKLEGRITFEDVSFKYSRSQDKPTLAGISLDILPGQTIALVGRSGSGKSTLGKLVLGMYLPLTGRLLIDGHDIRTIAPRSLRRRIGVVPQDVFLFSGTIRDNIALGDPDASFERIVRAAKLAGAHEFISGMGMGYDAKVGERGMSVSGGQRQRIALARALLNDPDILLLDEATSALDNESERLIQSNLAQASKERTSIVIAHRLSTVRDADRIIVLDESNIVESGTHDELLTKRGLYSILVGEQIQG